MHRSMSGGKIIFQILGKTNKAITKQKTPTIKLAGKAVELSTNMATALAKRFIKKVIKKAIDQSIGI